MTCLYFATPLANPAIECFKRHAHEPCNILTSFAFKDKVDTYIDALPRARLMLDSGAYTAWSCGQTVDINALIEYARHPRWSEVVALDVIGDADASVRNAITMKEAGLDVMPVFHIGDPIEHLLFYKSNFSKVGLSCRFGEPLHESLAFIRKCFAVAWPYRFHSFGWVSEKVLRKFPFDSADASTWVNPHRFGAVKPCGDSMSGGMRGQSFKLKRERSGNIDLWMVVERYKTLERSLEQQWRRELKTVRPATSASK
jgi:hypothetical protein